MKIVRGLCAFKSSLINNVDVLYKAWFNELARVYVDKLNNDDDVKWL